MDISLWKQRKKELKLTYEEISRLSGIPLTTVKYIFLGYVETPRIDTVQAIEKALGIIAQDDETGATRLVSVDEVVVLDKYREIKSLLGKEKGQACVVNLLDGIIENFKK